MPVDRWNLKRDGPPSQKIAIYARRIGLLGIGGGIVARVFGPNSTATVIVVLTGIVMFFVAYAVERRERRQEKLTEEADTLRALGAGTNPAHDPKA
jgi:hypothetical protein